MCRDTRIDGEVTTEFPTTHLLRKQNQYSRHFRDGNATSEESRKYEDLPENCRNYIEFIEKEIGYPITMVSNGPGRHDIIFRNK